MAVGSMGAVKAANRLQRQTLSSSSTLAKALHAPTRELVLSESRMRYYYRNGTGVPVVLLHSINAAASSFEMKPIFDHLAHTTTRPLYAPDWLGFGRSDRPARRYRPALYLRQLRRFLHTAVGEPADVVALSLGGEYAAGVAVADPALVRRLVLIAPTSLSRNARASWPARLGIRAADLVGAFELFFYRLTRRASLRSFYERQIFPDGFPVPDNLMDYAFHTSHVHGTHHAPRDFITGTLFMDAAARRFYQHLQTATLLVRPDGSADTIQDFDLLPGLLAANPDHLYAATVGAGLLPHWEQLEAFFDVLDSFLST